MKVACVLGSPRREGNTAKITGWVADELKAIGHEVDLVNILDFNIAGCQECYACKRETGFPGCVINDDLPLVVDRLEAADAVIFASPLFAWSYPAQLKALIDRCGSLIYGYPGSPDHASLLDGKPSALLVTCGGPAENNSELIATSFERLAAFAKMKHLGSFIFPGCFKPEDIDDEAAAQALQVAQVIAAG